MATKRLPKSTIERTNWNVMEILSKIPEFRVVEMGSDDLTFRIAGQNPVRTVYVNLLGDDPSAINFDLEDNNFDNSDFECGPEHGSVWSTGDLALVARWWLSPYSRYA